MIVCSGTVGIFLPNQVRLWIIEHSWPIRVMCIYHTKGCNRLVNSVYYPDYDWHWICPLDFHFCFWVLGFIRFGQEPWSNPQENWVNWGCNVTFTTKIASMPQWLNESIIKPDLTIYDKSFELLNWKSSQIKLKLCPIFQTSHSVHTASLPSWKPKSSFYHLFIPTICCCCSCQLVNIHAPLDLQFIRTYSFMILGYGALGGGINVP
jgi:hypothetical protein